VLKKVKIAPGTAAPLQGYFAIYSSTTFAYFQFNPLDGASVVNSAGEVTALGLAFHPVGVSAGGGSNGSSDNSSLNIECQSGSDGKLGVLDSCTGFIGGSSFSGHVVDCKDAPQIP